MYRIRVHGRTGQGVATTAELIAWAAIYDGHVALATPGFGSDRVGATVDAYCRIDDAPIGGLEPVDAPDAVLVLDATLLTPGLFSGLRPGGLALVNSSVPLTVPDIAHLVTVPATRIALARTGRAAAGVAMLGALAAASGIVGLEAVHTAVALRFSGPMAGDGREAADEAYAYLTAAAREGDGVGVDAVGFGVPSAIATGREARS